MTIYLIKCRTESDRTYMRLSNFIRAPDLSRQQITLGTMTKVVTIRRDLISASSLGLMRKYENVLEYSVLSTFLT